MHLFKPPDKNNSQAATLSPEYYSVEFPLGHFKRLYQFKLWRSEQNTFFLLAKESSDLVSQLKVGRIVPMKYYSEDAIQTNEVRNTQIAEIVKETTGRFSGHYRIELNIVSDGHSESRATGNTDNNDN